MMDRLPPMLRSANMSRIWSHDTKPEMAVRKILHGMGFRYRLHRRDLPRNARCRPAAMPQWKIVVQISGCFFHGHDCPSFRMPTSNVDFWQKKIRRNRERDVSTKTALMADG